MKKVFLTSLAIIVSLSTGSMVAMAKTNDVTTQQVGTLSEEDQKATDEKIKITQDYINNKIKTRSYGQRNVRYFPYARQEQSNWCGPATAYNAIKGVISSSQVSQYDLYKSLGTGDPGMGGTPFPGAWKGTMRAYLGSGNNYEALMGSNYSSSDWQDKVKNSVIYTVDKGYAVIGDTKQSPYGTKLHPNYNYIDDRGSGGASTYHYIAITGYDDTNGGNCDIFYSDPHQDFNGRYWTKLSNLSTVTKPLGILW